MSARDVQSHPVGENKSGGVFGAIRNTLGLGESTNSADKVVSERVETVTETHKVSAASKETTDEWRKAEAETVRAEEAAAKAEVLASKVDTINAQASEASKLKEEAERKLRDTQGRISDLDSHAEAKAAEAADLEKQLQAARAAAAQAERRRAVILEEASKATAPANDLKAEADKLDAESEAAHKKAIDLQKRIDALRTSKPISEASKAEEEATRLRAQVGSLHRDLTEEEKVAAAKQAAADNALRAATDKIREADEIAKVYWAARDLSKELEAHAKALAAEAADAAKAAEKKRATVDKLDDKAGDAARRAEEALQRKAELEREAQALLGSKASAEDRASQLEREAAARRAQAGQHERVAVSKRTEAEQVVVPVVPDSDLAKRAEEARRAADAAAAKKEGLQSDIERLQQLKLEADQASADKLSSVTTYRDEALALKKKEEEHWQRAKEHGDAAREISSEETKRRLQAVGESHTVTSHTEGGKTTTTHSSGGDTKTTTSRTGPIGSEERKEISTTNLSETVPSKPKGTSAGGVNLPVKESTEQYRKEEKVKQESTIRQ